MKKSITAKRVVMSKATKGSPRPATIGLDLGDKFSQYCVVNQQGSEIETGRVRTRPEELSKHFGKMKRVRIVIETGTHSPWVSRLLQGLGHEVIVANSRKLRLIYKNRRKADRVDARYLAKLGHKDTELVFPIEHRTQATQAELSLIRSREALMAARTQLVNHVRGAVKSFGGRLPSCSAATFHKRMATELPEPLREALLRVLDTIATLSQQIAAYDKLIAQRARKHSVARRLQQVQGVGPLTSLTYALTIERHERFARSRTVGAYLGLTPATADSGESSPQLRITKEGDVLLRRLLVGAAQYILGPFAQDSDLRRHGLAIAARGGKNAKKRAVVAVARKLAVLLHKLWKTEQDYVALYNHQQLEQVA